MTAGLLQTQIQNNFKFKSVFFQNSSLYTQSRFKSPTLISVFHTWNDKLYRHRRGKVYFNKSQSTQSLPAYQRFKGELWQSSMLRDRSSKQIGRFEMWQSASSKQSFQPLDVITQELCVLPNLKQDLWLLWLANNWNWGLKGTKQWNDKKDVWFPVKAELNKNKTQILNLSLKNKNKKKAYFTIQIPVSIYSSKQITDKPGSGTIYSS